MTTRPFGSVVLVNGIFRSPGASAWAGEAAAAVAKAARSNTAERMTTQRSEELPGRQGPRPRPDPRCLDAGWWQAYSDRDHVGQRDAGGRRSAGVGRRSLEGRLQRRRHVDDRTEKASDMPDR